MEIHGLLIKAISIHASHANNNHSTQAHLTLASKYSKRAGREVSSQSTSTCRYHVVKGAVSWPIRDLPEGGGGRVLTWGHWLHAGIIWERNNSNNNKTSNGMLVTGCRPPEIVI